MVVAFDVETTKKPLFLPWQRDARLVTFSPGSRAWSRSFTIWHPDNKGEHSATIDAIRECLHECTTLVAHNAKFDLHWLRWLLGDEVCNLNVYCTLVAEYILQNQRKLDGLSLNDLANHYGFPPKKDRVKLLWDSGYDTPEIPISVLNEYCAHDSNLALAIYYRQVPQIIARGLKPLISLEMEALKTLQEMEWNGMAIDTQFLNREEMLLAERYKEIEAQLYGVLPICNLGSGDQLSAALYGGTFCCDDTDVRRDHDGVTVSDGKTKRSRAVSLLGLGIVPPKDAALKKQGVFSTSAPILQQLKLTTPEQKEVVELLLEAAKIETLISTFYKPLQERTGSDGVIHHNLNQCITGTGRLSSSKPNLQNIPRGNNAPIKQAFVSRYV